MGAGKFVDQARLKPGLTGSKSLARRWNTCSCHPRQYGLKKGLRRGRRRLDRLVIQEELDESYGPSRPGNRRCGY